MREALAAGNLEQATAEFKLATKKLDQAAGKGVLARQRRRTRQIAALGRHQSRQAEAAPK